MPSRIWRDPFFAAFAVMFMLVAGWTAAVGAQSEPTPAAAPAPKAVWPQTTYEFPPLMEGEDVKHDFIVENKGQGPLAILKVQPD